MKSDDFHNASLLAKLGRRGDATYELRISGTQVWLVANSGGVDILAVRPGFAAEILGEPFFSDAPDGGVCEWKTAIGASRWKISLPAGGAATVRCTFSVLPVHEFRWKFAFRDLVFCDGTNGTVHTAQRGLRSGIFFAGLKAPSPVSVFYFQDFSSLGDFFEATSESPSGTVGGGLDVAGYLPPAGENCVLPAAREIVVSDAYVSIVDQAPESNGDIARRYLDCWADVYRSLSRPQLEYRNWPERAERALRDLTLSQECTFERQGDRYFMPYVGDSKKPPESMVQLTVLNNTLEYDQWRGSESRLARSIRPGVARFFEPAVGSVVRWLPGESFGEQSEDNMNHETMDSWYLYHSLFNVSRLASRGDKAASAMLRKSLPFAIRVARRFDYRWPIFFDLKTLDIVRAESEPGKGGEKDVAGLYALLMLHAYELFRDAEYLDEAKLAASSLRDFGFDLGYQMNTTGFAGEATLRLWQLTRDPLYRDLSEICLANLFDNMWLWKCEYGKAKHYRTFFGMFPLHDAQYLAAYEELEAHAKFYEYIRLAGDDLSPSLRFLLPEYLKYSLDRTWFYYPDTLQHDGIADKPRNGKIERALSVPLEDLQDGRKASGQVGQEVYGAGLAFVYATRHYVRVPQRNVMVFCQYPLFDIAFDGRGTPGSIRFKTRGARDGTCELRIVPIDPDVEVSGAAVFEAPTKSRKELDWTRSVEGHLTFGLRGGSTYEVSFAAPRRLGTKTHAPVRKRRKTSAKRTA